MYIKTNMIFFLFFRIFKTMYKKIMKIAENRPTATKLQLKKRLPKSDNTKNLDIQTEKRLWTPEAQYKCR